ncbi:MAG: hypothetical protein ACLT8Y_09435 [Dorea formicigenerans]
MNEQATQISLEIDDSAVYEEALKLDVQAIRELLSAKIIMSCLGASRM